MLNTSHTELRNKLNLIKSQAVQKDINIAIAYHANCNDGIVSAAVVLDHIVDTFVNYSYVLFPCDYGQEINPEIVDDRFDVLFIVDFSFKGPVLETLCDKISNVFVFDHHKTAVESLTKYFSTKSLPSNLFLSLTQERGVSGANLCWNILNPSTKIPDLVLDVADRDVWLFERPNSVLTHRGLLLQEDKREPIFVRQHFISIDRRQEDYENLVVLGKAAKNMWDFTLRELSETTFTTTFEDSEGIPVKCWLTNCPYMFVSDLSTVIMDSKDFDNEKDVCCMLTVREHDVKLSFRSKNERAKEFAEMFGGGGHPDAGGAENISLKELEQIFSCF